MKLSQVCAAIGFGIWITSVILRLANGRNDSATGFGYTSATFFLVAAIYYRLGEMEQKGNGDA